MSAAARRHVAEWRRAQRAELGREMEGNPRHPMRGTLYGYACGCRCERCRTERSRYARSWREARRERPWQS